MTNSMIKLGFKFLILILLLKTVPLLKLRLEWFYYCPLIGLNFVVNYYTFCRVNIDSVSAVLLKQLT